MAERLEDFDFNGSAPSARYPWKEWCDGSIWRLVQGEDFEVATTSMRAQIYVKAKRLGVGVRTNAITWGSAPIPERAADQTFVPRPANTEVLVIQFFNDEEDE